MKNIKFLILLVCASLLFPLVSNAATYSIEEKEIEGNVGIYDIVYDPAEEPAKEINLDLTKTNNNLNYEVIKNENGGIAGSCDEFPCHLSLDLVTTKTTLATVTITNPTSTEQTTVITLGGDVSSEPKTIALKAISTTTTSTTTQRVLNTDTSLSSINISAGALDQEFNKDVTEYNITGIKDTINRITVTPNCDNNCDWEISCPLGECSVSNSRTISLQNGANKVSIKVTSEDGENNKSYILNVYRGEIKTSSPYLSDIKITGSNLSPNFDTLTNDYSTTVGFDVEKLDLITTPEDPEASIVVKGNENLIVGENTVTITVTSSDGANNQVYTIIVTKEESKEEQPKEDDKKEDIPITKVEKKKNNLWLIIGISVATIIIIVVVFIIIFKKKKKNDKNDKNNPSGGIKRSSASDLLEENNIEKENTETLTFLDETRRQMNDEPKQDIDDALDDLMMTKRLELGDLGL